MQEACWRRVIEWFEGLHRPSRQRRRRMDRRGTFYGCATAPAEPSALHPASCAAQHCNISSWPCLSGRPKIFASCVGLENLERNEIMEGHRCKNKSKGGVTRSMHKVIFEVMDHRRIKLLAIQEVIGFLPPIFARIEVQVLQCKLRFLARSSTLYLILLRIWGGRHPEYPLDKDLPTHRRIYMGAVILDHTPHSIHRNEYLVPPGSSSHFRESAAFNLLLMIQSSKNSPSSEAFQLLTRAAYVRRARS
ncbi:hypothetical protein B0H11DRAFT_2063504, partial [Mycena galericulata]